MIMLILKDRYISDIIENGECADKDDAISIIASYFKNGKISSPDLIFYAIILVKIDIYFFEKIYEIVFGSGIMSYLYGPTQDMLDMMLEIAAVTLNKKVAKFLIDKGADHMTLLKYQFKKEFCIVSIHGNYCLYNDDSIDDVSYEISSFESFELDLRKNRLKIKVKLKTD